MLSGKMASNCAKREVGETGKAPGAVGSTMIKLQNCWGMREIREKRRLISSSPVSLPVSRSVRSVWKSAPAQ